MHAEKSLGRVKICGTPVMRRSLAGRQMEESNEFAKHFQICITTDNNFHDAFGIGTCPGKA
jgi:hypothetical protein